MFFLWRKSILLCFCWFSFICNCRVCYFLLILFVFVEVVYFVYIKHLQTKPAKFKKLSTKVTFQILEKASLSLEKKETRGLDIHTFQVSCVSNLLFQSCIRSYTNKGPSRVPPDSRGMLKIKKNKKNKNKK